MIKRCFDLILSSFLLICLSPFLLLISLLIKLDSKGPAFFTQTRVGKNNKDFTIYKFRTMVLQSETKGLLTLGNRDARITKVGYYLRLYKIDEFPQLFNILIGDMSFVGPRPELRHYVNYYKKEDHIIFSVRPGITSLASLKYRNEVELLKAAHDPEAYFINTIIPDKLRYNKEYVKRQNFWLDIKLIFMTLTRVLKIKTLARL